MFIKCLNNNSTIYIFGNKSKLHNIMQKVRKGPSWGPSQLGNMVHTWVQKPDPDGTASGVRLVRTWVGTRGYGMGHHWPGRVECMLTPRAIFRSFLAPEGARSQSLTSTCCSSTNPPQSFGLHVDLTRTYISTLVQPEQCQNIIFGFQLIIFTSLPSIILFYV